MTRRGIMVSYSLFAVLLVCVGCSGEDYLNRRAYNDAKAGKYGSALERYNEVLKISPRNAAAYFNRGVVRFKLGQVENAIDDYNRALQIDKGLVGAYANRGFAWSKKGEFELAIYDYTKALDLNNNTPSNATLLSDRAYAYYKIGKYEEAIGDYTNAIRLDQAGSKKYLYARAEVRYRKSDLDEAISDYTRTLELDPYFIDALFGRADTLCEKRDYASAIADYDRITKLDPSNALAYSNYSALLSSCPERRFRNGTKAVELAAKAVALCPNETLFLSALAGAYAELGRFEDAVLTIRKAILGLKAHNIELKKRLKIQLEAYGAGKPWREDCKWKPWMDNYSMREGAECTSQTD